MSKNLEGFIGSMIRHFKEDPVIKHHFGKSTPSYDVYIDGYSDRYVEAEDGTFHMLFLKRSGFTVKWGKTFKEDPPYCPFGPEIADIEITKMCRGIRDKEGNRAPCGHCSPAGTLIKTPSGDVPIEAILQGDYVMGYDFSRGTLQVQEVKETYIRDYSGELICIVLEDGTSIRLTPNHPVMLADGKQVPAGDLKETDELVSW